jgi:alpha-L-rhamnosidase
MNSFNHYAYGAIGDWMYRTMAGIDTESDAPGYKRITIKPHLTNKLTFANAALETYYGKVASHWKKEGSKLQLEVQIPANTTATIYIPSTSADKVREGGRLLNAVKEIRQKGSDSSYVAVEVGSGKYVFTTE